MSRKTQSLILQNQIAAEPWLPWIALPLAAGAALTLADHLSVSLTVALGLACIVLAAALIRVGPHALPLRWVARGCIGVSSLLAGILLTGPPIVAVSAGTTSATRLLEITGIAQTVAWQDRTQGISVIVEHSDDPGGYVPRRVFVRGPIAPDIRPGDRLIARGTWVRDERGDRLTAVEIERLAARENGPRQATWQALDRLGTHRELGQALLLGLGSPPEKALFRETGLMHVLAVSGVHLAIAAALGLWLLTRLRVPWWWRQVAVGGLIIGYAWLTSGSPATIRALAMGLAVVAYGMTAREGHRLGAVSLAALVLLLVDPSYGRDVGFQLSLAAVLGIVTLGSDAVRWRERLLPLQPWPLDRSAWRWLLAGLRATADGLLIGIAATLATAPVLAVQVGVVAPWAPIGTLLASPPTTIALWSGLPLIGLAGWWPNGPWEGLYLVLEGSLTALVGAVQLAHHLPGQQEIAAPSPWLMLLWPLIFMPADRSEPPSASDHDANTTARPWPSPRRLLTRIGIAIALIVGWWLT